METDTDIQIPVDIPQEYVPLIKGNKKKIPELNYYMKKKEHHDDLMRDTSIKMYPADKMVPVEMSPATRKMSRKMSKTRKSRKMSRKLSRKMSQKKFISLKKK